MARDLVKRAFEASQKVVDRAMDATMADDAKPDERQMAARYMALHRGNPLSMADFVRRSVPAGKPVNLLSEMGRYETAMEALMRKYGLHRAQGGR